MMFFIIRRVFEITKISKNPKSLINARVWGDQKSLCWLAGSLRLCNGIGYGAKRSILALKVNRPGVSPYSDHVKMMKIEGPEKNKSVQSLNLQIDRTKGTGYGEFSLGDERCDARSDHAGDSYGGSLLIILDWASVIMGEVDVFLRIERWWSFNVVCSWGAAQKSGFWEGCWR